MPRRLQLQGPKQNKFGTYSLPLHFAFYVQPTHVLRSRGLTTHAYSYPIQLSRIWVGEVMANSCSTVVFAKFVSSALTARFRTDLLKSILGWDHDVFVVARESPLRAVRFLQEVYGLQTSTVR